MEGTERRLFVVDFSGGYYYGWEDRDYYSNGGGRTDKTDVMKATVDTTYTRTISDNATYSASTTITYREPIAKYMQISFIYRPSWSLRTRDYASYSTDNTHHIDPEKRNPYTSNIANSTFTYHRAGAAYRYARRRNWTTISLFYQYTELLNKNHSTQKAESFGYHNFIYNATLQWSFDKQNSMRISFNSDVKAPNMSQLQDYYNVSNSQYLSRGNSHLKPFTEHSELLALMGVKIITSESIRTEFEAKTESRELKDILKGRISALALLASGENADKPTYRSNKSKLVDLIEQTYFYHCKKIKLTYGDSTDVMVKHTFGNKNEFYYIGDLRPANVEPLLTPLCKYLELKNKERELFILFIEDMDGIRQNLEDKGYNVSLLEEDPVAESGNIQTSLNRIRTESQYDRDVITGFKGEIIVYEKLISMGYHPECLSISTKDDYTHEITMNGKTYFCKPNYEKYDISFVTNNGVQMYVEVKATTWEKQFQENLPISYRELTMIEKYNESDDKSYIIVRVFGVDKPQQDIYMFKGHLF